MKNLALISSPVTDEDGNEFELEHLDTLEYNGQTYMAFFRPWRGKRTAL